MLGHASLAASSKRFASMLSVITVASLLLSACGAGNKGFKAEEKHLSQREQLEQLEAKLLKKQGRSSTSAFKSNAALQATTKPDTQNTSLEDKARLANNPDYQPSRKQEKPKSKKPEDLDWPPFVPSRLYFKQNPNRSAAQGYLNPARALSRLEQPHFADMEGIDPAQPWGARLLEALSYAQQKHQLLLPVQGEDRLEWQKPVTREELAQWLVVFGKLPLPQAPEGLGAYQDVPVSSLNYAAIAAVCKQGWLRPFAAAKVSAPTSSEQMPNAEEVLSGDVEKLSKLPRFDPKGLLRRQELCLTYLRLSAQQAYLNQVAVDQRESLQDWFPPNADPAETIDTLPDWWQVAQGYRQAVAIAYRDGVLENTFGLNPTQLLRLGLQPNRPVSRGEVLIFLYDMTQKGRLS